MRNANRIGAAAHQLQRQFESAIVGADKAECAGVGEHGCVKTGCHVGSAARAHGFAKLVDHFRDRTSLRINPVHMREAATAVVMVDVNEEPAVEPFEPRALHTVAFENDGSIGGIVRNIAAMLYGFSERKRGINQWHSIAHNDMRSLAK